MTAPIPAIDFAALRRQVMDAGCFQPAPGRAVASFFLHLLAAGGLFAMAAYGPTWALVPLFTTASLAFYRLGWLMHDAAHGATFGSAPWNRRFATLVAGTLGELPSGWRYGHNRHHAAPNVRGRDLDQSERWDPDRRFRSAWVAALDLFLTSRFRGFWLPKSMLLLGLRDGYWAYRHHRSAFPVELAAAVAGFLVQLVWFILCFGAWAPLAFAAHWFIGLVYLNAAFAGNHYDLESFDPDAAHQIPFDELQLRTTRNYRGGAVTRFVLGGLENQIEHHLFPNLPRHQLRRAAPLVRAYATSRGLPYHEATFFQAMRQVVRFHLDPNAPAWFPALAHLQLANVITATSLGLGVAGVGLAGTGDLDAALLCGVLALPCDVLDGAVARRTGTASPFGARFDTLADLTSFGVLPAAVAIAAGLDGAAMVLPVAFALGAAVRLARYDEVGLHEKNGRTCFEGVPTPHVAAGFWVGFAGSGALPPDAAVVWLGILCAIGPILHNAAFSVPKQGWHVRTMWGAVPAAAAFAWWLP
jgi:phosphatidylserine synthase/fatty acid desaturase